MPLVKSGNPVEEKAVQSAQTEAKKEVIKEPEPELETPEPEPETAAAEPAPTTGALNEPELEEAEPEPAATVQEGAKPTTGTEVAQVNGRSVASRQNSMQVAQQGMAERGFEGGKLDFTSFTNIVLKDGEFQIVGTTNVLDAVKGFDAIITTDRDKYAMKVGNDDDADVVFAEHKEEFNDPNTEAGQKVAEWRAEGLKPELKQYVEVYCIVVAVHGEEGKDLEGEMVVIQVSPQSVGRYTGYKTIQNVKRQRDPDGYTTRILRGPKVTSAKFPFYPWDFKFVCLN